MSTRSSIWLGEDKGKSVHIYWELAEREVEDEKRMRAPIYIAVMAGTQMRRSRSDCRRKLPCDS